MSSRGRTGREHRGSESIIMNQTSQPTLQLLKSSLDNLDTKFATNRSFWISCLPRLLNADDGVFYLFLQKQK